MIKKIGYILKHFFIPYEHNDYKPHCFREIPLLIILVAILVLFSVSAGSALAIRNTDIGELILSNVLIDLTNKDRLSHQLSFLSYNQTLESAAQMKAGDMASRQYFAHTSPDGIDPWHWFKVAGYTFLYAGENLAVNFQESSQVEDAWMNSPAHRANILDNRFKEIGIATENGMYKGATTTFVVQLFGTRAISRKVTTTSESNVSTSTTKSVSTTTTPASALAVKEEVGSVLSATKIEAEVPVVATSTKDEELSSIVSSPNLIAVKNNQNVEEIIPVTPVEATTYSTWYERLLFNAPQYIGVLFSIIFVIIFIALVLMIVIEIKKQHPKHIFYGVIMLGILLTLTYLNKEMFIPHFIFLF